MKIQKAKGAILLLIVLTLTITLVNADPAGVNIVSNETEIVDAADPDNRTDPGGSITTLVLNALQQTNRWKAYIGNVTGTLTLADGSGDSIFSWALDDSSITGEVYSSRSDNILWSQIRCADNTIVTSEETFLGMDSSDIYSITETFNETLHPELTVGSTVITEDTCASTSTYVNDAPQSQASADFPLTLLDDETNLVFVNPLNPQTAGFDGSLFDFQMIVPNNPSDSTTYFFYAEIGG